MEKRKIKKEGFFLEYINKLFFFKLKNDKIQKSIWEQSLMVEQTS